MSTAVTLASPPPLPGVQTPTNTGSKLRRLLPKHNPSLLHASQDPRHRANRARDWEFRRSNRTLRFHLLRALCLPSHALLFARSRSWRRRLASVRVEAGFSKENEALIMSKHITAEKLLQGEDANIRTLVLQEVEERLGGHLIGDSMTKIKALIRKLKFEAIDAQGIGQAFAGLERFQAGIPQKEFAKIASGVKKHKL
ncbi:hypothetical protein QTJ16_001806 [Diplocarpon rosae]|uniref:Uncharacterized protein n=1 Tax=Diplocarpon rosae TaxID=946125 RepID=A0AAD9T266_9HELO|nr:hypothetical protein QTJ16_001806 [Diplocarpon rosae]